MRYANFSGEKTIFPEIYFFDSISSPEILNYFFWGFGGVFWTEKKIIVFNCG